MNKKEIVEEVVVSDSVSTRTSTMTNNALSAAGAGGGDSTQNPNPELTPRKATIAYWRSHGKYSLKSLSWI